MIAEFSLSRPTYKKNLKQLLLGKKLLKISYKFTLEKVDFKKSNA